MLFQTFFREKLNEKMENITDAFFDYVRSQLFAKNEEDKMISAESVYKILNKDKKSRPYSRTACVVLAVRDRVSVPTHAHSVTKDIEHSLVVISLLCGA